MATVSTEVIVRNQMGRFIADVRGAATRSVEEALDVGISAARMQAPERTGRLRASFVPAILTRTSGVFLNTAPYAEFQDQGAGPHEISAWVRFFWEREGRMWMNPAQYLSRTGYPGADPIHHPGNPATHFMDAGYDAIKRRMQAIIRRNYPG